MAAREAVGVAAIVAAALNEETKAPLEGPQAEFAERFARRRLGEDPSGRWNHDAAVIARAHEVAATLPERERDVLLTAAALHDLGFAPVARETGFQPLDGARYLARFGFSERICALVANCVSARIEAELRDLSDAYRAYPDEEGPVRDGLWFCCITTASDGGRIDVDERVDQWPARYPEPLVVEFAARARGPLRAAVERTERRLRAGDSGV